jgi:hypothetical protein
MNWRVSSKFAKKHLRRLDFDFGLANGALLLLRSRSRSNSASQTRTSSGESGFEGDEWTVGMTVATLEAMEDEQPDVEARSPLSAQTVIRRPSLTRLLIKRSCLQRFW